MAVLRQCRPHRDRLLGPGLFDFSFKTKGDTFRERFAAAAGTYAYECSFHSSMHGTVAVPMAVRPAQGGTATAFLVRWATTRAAAGNVYDVQIRRPADADFVAFSSGPKRQASFVPDAGPGEYRFPAGRRRLSGGAVDFSPELVIPVADQPGTRRSRENVPTEPVQGSPAFLPRSPAV